MPDRQVRGSKSLRGGTLLMTPMLGADGETYAIAQGNLVVGGLGVTGNDGSSVIVNIPTVGRIPRGASIEKMVDTPFQSTDNVLLNLHQSDFSTAMRVADAVNEVFGPEVAVPLDASTIKVRAPVDRRKGLLRNLLENIEVDPARPAAKVIVNSRTGTIVIGGDVRVTLGGDPRIADRADQEDKQVTQSTNLAQNAQGAVVTPGEEQHRRHRDHHRAGTRPCVHLRSGCPTSWMPSTELGPARPTWWRFSRRFAKLRAEIIVI